MDGFGSPVASPGCTNVGAPANTYGGCKLSTRRDASPLQFRRTPLPPVKGIDSSKKFGDWVLNTSPYAGQTPPSVSMKSVAAENTPPAQHEVPITDGPVNSHRFQAWLKATGSASWTPKQGANADTPPRVPPHLPAGTPMSVSDVPASAASPATEEPRSRPLFDLAASDTDSDGDEADTVVGMKEVAVAAARMRAALLSAGTSMNHAAAANRSSSMVPVPGLRAPAPSPVISSPVPAAPYAQQQATADMLATPMSQLSMSNDNSCFGKDAHAASWRSRMTPNCSEQAPSSPVDKVISLMLEIGQLHGDHHSLHRTPSRLASAVNSQPPCSPEQQVIQLMLQGQDCFGGDQEDRGAAVRVGKQQNTAEQLPGVSPSPTRPIAFSNPDTVSSIAHGSEAAYSSIGTESDDEIDVAELQQLVGVSANPSTPLNDIISMLLTPQLKATPNLLVNGAQAAYAQFEEGMGPRVLFADD